MKRLISIILTLCLLLGLMPTLAFAEEAPLFLVTDDSYGVTVFKTNVDYPTTTPHSNALAFAGYNSDYFMIREYSGTIDFHDYSVAAGHDYQSLQIDKGSDVTLRFYGENAFYGSLNGLSVYEGSNVIIDVAPNSSVTFYSTGDYDAVYSNQSDGSVVTLKDGSPLPAPDANGVVTVTNGTPAPCAHTYTYTDDDNCFMTCPAAGYSSALAHSIISVNNGDTHTEVCEYCDHPFGTADHQIYYANGNAEGCYEYCYYCDYEGEITPHDMSMYLPYDDEYCVPACSKCGEMDETALIPHETFTYTVPATETEAGKEAVECLNCNYYTEKYEENTIHFTLSSEDEVDWDNSAIIVLKNGEPLTLVRKYITHYSEEYAIPFDKNATYSFMWMGRHNLSESFGVDITFPDGTHGKCFEQLWSNSVPDFLYSYNQTNDADFLLQLYSIPDLLEYYTKDSVQKLTPLIKKARLFIPSAHQDKQDRLTGELKAALEGLVPTETAQPTGLVHVSDHLVITEEGYTLGEEYFPYQGDYVLFSTAPSNHSITVESTKVNITAVNLRLFGEDGALRLTDGADVDLTALGTNLFMPDAKYERAGIYVSESSKLTVNKNSESIIAVGNDNNAGIGGECSYDGDSYTALDAGTVTVNGGTVFALSDDDGAGIGGAYLGSFRKIVINDGRVHAECLDNDGAGIGAGDDGNGGDIVINGGNVTALSLDDDGAGIGGADSGHVDSITINGGVILVGTDDGASIGGGSDADSYGGKIVINGGTIHQHFDDGSDFYIGNDSENETGETDYNFVQINGGNIIGEDEIFPTPANKNDESVYPRTFKMPEDLIGQTITVKYSDGTSFKAAVIGEDLTVYLPIGTHVVGAENWGHGHEYNAHHYNFDATCKKDGTNTYYCGYCGKTKTVTAKGTKLADTSKQFKDVSPKAWYKNAVDFAVTNGIFKGTSKTAFSPEDNMTRAQFVQVFANLAGVDTTNNKVTSGFKDVPKGKWYTAAVTWAAKNKVVNGIGGGKFAPEALVTREQMCVMLVNFVENYWGAKLPQEISPKKFADDARISSWAESAVYKCAGARLVNGIGNNKFDPAGNATRAQGATLFTNFIKIV